MNVYHRIPPYLYCLLFFLTLLVAAYCQGLAGLNRQFLPAKDAMRGVVSGPVEKWMEISQQSKMVVPTFEGIDDSDLPGTRQTTLFSTASEPDSVKGKHTQGSGILYIAVKKTWDKYGWTSVLMGLGFLFSFFLIWLWDYERRNHRHRIASAFEQVQNLKQALQMLHNSNKDLKQKLIVQGHLLACIAHDIRTPLSFISSAARDATRQFENRQKDRLLKTNEIIAYTSDEMVDLVDNLLIFMKTGVYGERIRFEKVNLRRLVQEKTRIFSQIAKSRKGSLTIDVSAEIFVNTNASLLGIIIHNLVDNAFKVKASNQIGIFCLVRAGAIQLVIADQGPGMPDPLIQWLSGNSQEAATTSGYTASAGLGLILVREISRMLGISVRAENLPGANVYLHLGA